MFLVVNKMASKVISRQFLEKRHWRTEDKKSTTGSMREEERKPSEWKYDGCMAFRAHLYAERITKLKKQNREEVKEIHSGAKALAASHLAF